MSTEPHTLHQLGFKEVYERSETVLPCRRGWQDAWVSPWNFIQWGSNRAFFIQQCLAQVCKAVEQERIERAVA